MERSRKRIVKSKYFLWLTRLIKLRQTPKNAGKLNIVRTLYSKKFFCIVPNDDNRAADGIDLREKYAESFNESSEVYGSCSVLEMLIGLAFRMDFILTNPEDRPKIEKWFWEMVGNLSLEEGESRDSIEANETILNNFLQRTYEWNGSGGGLFPLRDPHEDQRNVEIWYQLMAYLDENYPM